MTENLRWRKSGFSSGQETCVEVAHTRAALRDSKNPGGPVLTADVTGLLAAVRTGFIAR